MPKTKFQDFIFTVIMVIVMVYAMICYNIAISNGELTNSVFLEAFKELPIMGVIAFILEFFIIGKVTKGITFKLINPEKVPPILITVMISSLIVAFMCPIMSFMATVIFNYTNLESLISTWLQITILNFPMAFFWQIFYAGPLVRFIFRKLFKKQLAS